MRWWCYIWEHYLVPRGSWCDKMRHQQHQDDQYIHSPSPVWPVSLHPWRWTTGKDDNKLRVPSLIISIIAGPTFWWRDLQCNGDQSHRYQHRRWLSCFIQCENWDYFWLSNKVKFWKWNLFFELYFLATVLREESSSSGQIKLNWTTTEWPDARFSTRIQMIFGNFSTDFSVLLAIFSL